MRACQDSSELSANSIEALAARRLAAMAIHSTVRDDASQRGSVSSAWSKMRLESTASLSWRSLAKPRHLPDRFETARTAYKCPEGILRPVRSRFSWSELKHPTSTCRSGSYSIKVTQGMPGETVWRGKHAVSAEQALAWQRKPGAARLAVGDLSRAVPERKALLALAAGRAYSDIPSNLEATSAKALPFAQPLPGLLSALDLESLAARPVGRSKPGRVAPSGGLLHSFPQHGKQDSCALPLQYLQLPGRITELNGTPQKHLASFHRR